VWSVRGQPQVVFGFTLEEGRIVEIEMLGDPDVLPTLDLAATPQLPKGTGLGSAD